MKGIRIIAVALMAGLFASCNPMHEPVTKKLDKDQLTEAIKRDTMFPKFYDQVQLNVDLMTETDRLKYDKMDYDRLFTYYKKTKNFSDENPLAKALYKRWFKDYDKKVHTFEEPMDEMGNKYRELHKKNPNDPEIPIMIGVYLDKEESDKSSPDYHEKRARFKDLMSLEFFAEELELEQFLKGKKDSLFKSWDALAWEFYNHNK